MELLAEKGTVTFEDLKLNFTGSLPDSLEMRYIKKQFPAKFCTSKKDRTTAILDVAFTDDLKEILDTPAKIFKEKTRVAKIKN